MENNQKKRRLLVSVRKTNIWAEILHVWTKISRLPSLVDASNKKCSRFVVFNGTREETLVDIHQLDSPGNHSEVYEIILNGHLKNAILKSFSTLIKFAKTSYNLVSYTPAVLRVQ